jgi:hypothetical protein
MKMPGSDPAAGGGTASGSSTRRADSGRNTAAPASRGEKDTEAAATDAPSQSLSVRNPRATTIDALFGPLPTVESAGRVWVFVDHQLKPMRVRLGITDGQVTELLQGDGIEEGTELVTNVTTGNETTRPAATGFPFMGQPGRFGGPGGFPGGGGGGNRGGGGGR